MSIVGVSEDALKGEGVPSVLNIHFRERMASSMWGTTYIRYASLFAVLSHPILKRPDGYLRIVECHK
jgi:hypothetical protein